MTETAVCFGNCQALALEHLLHTNEAFTERFAFRTFPAVQDIPAEQIPELHEAVGEATLVLLQQVTEGYRQGIGLGSATLAGLARPGAHIVHYPSMYFDGYIPDLMYLRDDAGGHVLEGPFDYHDRLVLEAYAAGATVPETIAMLLDPERPSGALAAAELTLSTLRAREEGCEAGIAEYTESRFRDELLFFTMNHPSNALVGHVADQVYDLIGLPGRSDVTRLPGELLGSTQYPLHAADVRDLGLTFGDTVTADVQGYHIRTVLHEVPEAIRMFFDFYDANERYLAFNLPSQAR